MPKKGAFTPQSQEYQPVIIKVITSNNKEKFGQQQMATNGC